MTGLTTDDKHQCGSRVKMSGGGGDGALDALDLALDSSLSREGRRQKSPAEDE